jgi:predicted permease
LVERLAALPGVAEVSFGAPGPYQGGTASGGLRVPGSTRTARDPAEVPMQFVGPRFFSTIGSPVLSGREFETTDTPTARKVAVVNQAFAKLFFPGVPDPTGRVISFDDSKPEGGEPTYVVGVARDMLHAGLRTKAEPTVYVPTTQVLPAFAEPWLLVRPRILPGVMWPRVRQTVAALNPDVAINDPRTIRERIDDSIFLDRMVASVSGFFGLLALALAGIGLYGVLSYNVALRTSEIGVRVALGSTRGRIARTVLGDGLLLVALGIAVGLPLSLVAGKIASSLLYSIRPTDSVTFVVTIIVLASAGAAAAIIPARRASSIDPMAALRGE